MERIAWHPAFCGAVKLELAEYRDVLQFLEEHPLTSEPQKIDVLIIKKNPDAVIDKNFGRIFREYNIIEYKSPTDSVTIGNYHKVHGYCRNYADQSHVPIENMSMTLVVTRYPRELMKYLKKRFGVTKSQDGIYYVISDAITTQIVVTKELSEDENLWFRNLNNRLTVTNLDCILEERQQHSELTALRVYLDVVVKANSATFNKLRKMGKSQTFTEFLREWGINAGLQDKGIVMGKTEDVITVLRARFGSVPKGICDSINSYSDATALDSLLQSAATCSSIKDFRQNLVR